MTKSHLGFSFIQIIIVIGIFGVIAGGLFYYTDPLTFIEKTNDARRKSDIRLIQKALERYYNDHGRYPLSSDYNIIRLNNTVIMKGDASWDPYMSKVPFDTSPKKYVYWVNDTRQSYLLYASLDRGGLDKEACFRDSNKNGTPCSGLQINNIPENVCFGGGLQTCSFGVSSSNLTP